MKILRQNIENFIQNIQNSGVKAMLLYGQDIGILMERESEIKQKFQGNELIKIDLNERPFSDAFSESFTDSFFSHSKLILITGTEVKLSQIGVILEKIKEEFSHFILILIYENLDAKSKIRKLFEDGKLTASIPCFADEEVDVKNIIKSFFSENKLLLEQESVNYIAEKFKGNRALLKRELEKLKTYKGAGKVSLLDIKASMDVAEEGNIFEVVNYFFSLKLKSFYDGIIILKAENLPASVIVSSIISYHFKLLEILEEKEVSGKTIETILGEKFIFFKQIPKMKDHLSKWDLTRLHNLSLKLLETEIKCRKNFEKGYEYLTILLTYYKL